MNRRRLAAEVWIVLGLSLGQAAVYAVVSLAATLYRGPLRDATATLNGNRSELAWLDLTLQLLAIGFALVPVALAVYLVGCGPLGLDRRRPVQDLAFGAGLALVIGLPGLGLYGLGRELGVTAQVVPVPAHTYVWTVPLLLFAALENAIVEEVIAVGYLLTQLKRLHWHAWQAIAGSALLRGTYHLYQGFGPAIANAAMGAIFGWLYHRTGRLAPLIVAHALLDVVAFVGYLWFGDTLGGLN